MNNVIPMEEFKNARMIREHQEALHKHDQKYAAANATKKMMVESIVLVCKAKGLDITQLKGINLIIQLLNGTIDDAFGFDSDVQTLLDVIGIMKKEIQNEEDEINSRRMI